VVDNATVWLGLRQGPFPFIGWCVTTIWQVTLRIFEMEFRVHSLTKLLSTNNMKQWQQQQTIVAADQCRTTDSTSSQTVLKIMRTKLQTLLRFE